MKFLEAVYFILAGIIFWVIFSPILLTCFVVFSISKVVVLIFVKIVRPDLIPLGLNDIFFAIHPCDKTPLMYVGTTFRLQGRMETEHLMNRWKECFLSEEDSERYRNLYCYFTEYAGYIFKKRVKQIELKNHFTEKILPRGTEPEEYLSKWMTSNTSRSKSEGQPCWQVLILRRSPEWDTKKEETIVSIKMHHGMCDGYSLVHMIDKLTGTRSPYMVTKTKKECFLTWVKHMLEATSLTYDVFIRIIRTRDMFKQGNPFETNWVMSFATLDELETVKYIRKMTNAKFSNIVMTAMTGAIKKMNIEEKGLGLKDIPEQLFFESPLARPNHPAMTKGGTFCNHFTCGIYASNLHSNDNLRRLRALEHDFHSFQEHGGMRLMSWILFGYYWIHPAPIRRLFTNYVSWLWRFSVLYSGMMTSPTKVSLLGHEVENIYFLQATASAFPFVSLFIMCSTYAGKLDVSLYASKDFVKSKQGLETLIQKYFKEELQEMRQQLKEHEEKNKSIVLDIEGDGTKGNFLKYWFCQTKTNM